METHIAQLDWGPIQSNRLQEEEKNRYKSKAHFESNFVHVRYNKNLIYNEM